MSERDQFELVVLAKQINGFHAKNETRLGRFHGEGIHNPRGGVHTHPAQILDTALRQSGQNGLPDEVGKLTYTIIVVLKIHRRGNDGIEGPALVLPLIMLEKIWQRNPSMDPRANHIITPHTSHERVPLVRILMQHPTTKGLGIAQTQILKVRERRAGQNVRRGGKTIQGRRRSRTPLKVNPGTRRRIDTDSLRIEPIQDDGWTPSAPAHVKIELLNREGGNPIQKYYYNSPTPHYGNKKGGGERGTVNRSTRGSVAER